LFSQESSGNLTDTAKHGIHYYNPNDKAKTTLEEVLSEPVPMGNMGFSVMKTTVIDPNDFIARTTLKETNIDSNHIGFQDVMNPKTHVLPEQCSPTTIKETTLFVPTSSMSMGTDKFPQRLLDKESLTPDTTIKDLTLERKHEGAAYQKQDMGYTTTSHYPRNTNRNVFSVKDYYGVSTAESEQRGSYTVTKVDVLPTQRDFYADYEYNGSANSKNKKPVSRENYENHEFTGIKESLEKGREPTPEGVKIASSTENVNLSIIKRQNIEIEDTNEMINRIKGSNYVNIAQTTKEKANPSNQQNINANSTDHSFRNEPDIMKAYHDNPFTIKYGNNH